MYSPRIQSARDILGYFATHFTLYEYQCDPEQCGHSDSVILRAPNYVSVCFSIEELQEKKNSLTPNSTLSYEDWIRSHFLGPEKCIR